MQSNDSILKSTYPFKGNIMYQLKFKSSDIVGAVKTETQILGIYANHIHLLTPDEVIHCIAKRISVNTEAITHKLHAYMVFFKRDVKTMIDYLMKMDGNYWIQSDYFKLLKTSLIGSEIQNTSLILTFHKPLPLPLKKQLQEML